MGVLANSLRIERSLSAADRLQQEIEAWLVKRASRDSLQQHTTQLNALKEALVQPLVAVRQQLCNIVANTPSRDVYEACRLQDLRITFVRYVWNYYATKFDQRDPPGPYCKTLEVADEIVWSCYASSFAYRPLLKRGSVPLPYIEAKFAPEALVRDIAPLDLTLGAQDQLLAQFLQKLPIPIVTLPLSCVEAPWELVLLGHEVAHHLEYDLVPDKGLVQEFKQWLWDNAPGWADWDIETYADLAALCSMGPYAVRAIVELELAGDRAMLELKPATAAGPARYPRSAARIELIRRAAEALGLDPREALGDFDPDALIGDNNSDDATLINLRMAAKNDYAMAKTIADNVFEYQFAQVGSFKQRFGWVRSSGAPDEAAGYFLPDGAVQAWARELKKPGEPAGNPSLHAPRLIVGGSYKAWIDLVSTIQNADQRAQRMEQLKTRILKVIPERREPGTRAASNVTATDLKALGDELTRLTLESLHRVE